MHTLTYAGPFAEELTTALKTIQVASAEVCSIYESQSAETYIKGDGSPVTDADLASDRIIRQHLSEAFPGDALLTEEGVKDTARLRNRRCWIADPIDGTAEYVSRSGLFDIIIALVEDHRPVVAVAIQPVTGLILAAVAGQGAWSIVDGVTSRFTIAPATTPPRIVGSKWYGGTEAVRGAGLRAVASRMGSESPVILDVGFQPRAFLIDRKWDAFVGLPQLDRGSIAQEWDFACPDLITHEAGGRFTDCWGRLHQYNKRSTNVSGGIVASCSPALHQHILDEISRELPDHIHALDPADDDAPERPA